jgi:hypothetical protein
MSKLLIIRSYKFLKCDNVTVVNLSRCIIIGTCFVYLFSFIYDILKL